MPADLVTKLRGLDRSQARQALTHLQRLLARDSAYRARYPANPIQVLDTQTKAAIIAAVAELSGRLSITQLSNLGG